MKELLLGSGRRKHKLLKVAKEDGFEFNDVTTVDINSEVHPDIVMDLSSTKWWLDSDTYDEVHAYDILEHIGVQGDWATFFGQFSEIWRVLKPGGHLLAIVPMWNSLWAWGDPGHTRVISNASLSFLSQNHYSAQIGVSPMTDYRHIYKADFEPVWHMEDGERFLFVRKAIKPARL